MAEKIAVIGSNSFSGAHFVNYALNQGARVLGVSRSEEPIAPFLPYKSNKDLGNFKFQKLDINNNLPRIMAQIEDLQPEYVVNFASQSMVAESWANPDHWFQTNMVGQVRFHDQLRKLKFLKKYVHISTPEVYGSCSGNVTEEAPYNPSTPYAVSRAACDMNLLNYVKTYKFPVVFTRAANVYGPGQQLYRIIPRTILYAKLGKTLQLHGGGHSVRSFIHIEDVSDGTWKVMKDAPMGQIYHLSTREQVSIRELVSQIATKMGKTFESLVQVVDDRTGKDAAYLLDSAKIEKTLGWKDRVSLKQGLEDTIQWVEKNFELLKNQPLDYIHKP